MPGAFRVMRCDECRSTYPDPCPTREGMAAYYPEDYYAYREPVRHQLFSRTDPAARLWYACRRGTLRRRHRYDHLGGSTVLAEAVGRLPPVHRAAIFSLDALLHPFVPDGALLELGCGSGAYLDLMRALGWRRVVGVDVSESAVRRVHEVLGIEAYLGDIREHGLPDQSFDAVSMSHTLEHLHDPVAALSEIRRLTKPGGRVAIVVPNVSSLGSRVLGRHWIGLDVPRHVVNFTPRGLRQALARAGLEVVALKTSAQAAYTFVAMGAARRNGVPHSRYASAEYRFSTGEGATAGAVIAAEYVACGLWIPIGELIFAVARA